MHPQSPKLLDDIQRICDFLATDLAGETLVSYLDDQRMRQSAERSLEIIGEALLRLRRIDLEIPLRISKFQDIIGLRNRLAHGYDEDIDDTIVWRAIQESVPVLRAEVETLLREAENDTR